MPNKVSRQIRRRDISLSDRQTGMNIIACSLVAYIIRR